MNLPTVSFQVQLLAGSATAAGAAATRSGAAPVGALPLLDQLSARGADLIGAARVQLPMDAAAAAISASCCQVRRSLLGASRCCSRTNIVAGHDDVG